MPKYDYTEYELNEWEKYKRARSSTKELILDYSSCKVRISTKDKMVGIYVDEALARRYDEMVKSDAQRTDIDQEKNAAVMAESEDDEPSEAEIKLDRLCKKFNISFRDDVEEGQPVPKHYAHEEYANALSGSYIEYPLGEGILDFCYFDIKKNASVFALLFMLMSDEGANIVRESNGEEGKTERTVKFKSQDETIEFQDYRWENTLLMGKDFFYNSLFTAVFPPIFMDASKKTIDRYIRYLLLLKKEFEEKLQFCFDMDFYPSVLGHLYPCERYRLYCQVYKDLPTVHSRSEEFTIGRHTTEEDNMPFGFSSDFMLKRLNMPFDTETDEYKDFVEKYDPRGMLSEIILKVPSTISISYTCRSVFDMLNLEFTKMLEADIRIRKCKRCGRYFIMKGNYDTNYCNRVAEGQTRSCQDLAAQENYKAKAAENPALPIYSKYYKRYAARVRSRQIKEADFKKWKFQALTKRDECTDGKITVDEFVEWLETSFPNRKPKE